MLGMVLVVSLTCLCLVYVRASKCAAWTTPDEPSTKTRLNEIKADRSSPSFRSLPSGGGKEEDVATSNADRLFLSGGVGMQRVPPRLSPAAGQSIIIIGAGTAGAAAAVGLAERGFKVLLFERDMSLQDRIVGELLQPGGVRALERLGLDECAKEGIDSVHVDGYVVFTPPQHKKEGGEKVQSILLKYPAYDPATLKELFGVIDPSPSSPAADCPTLSLSPPRFSEKEGDKLVHGAGRAVTPPFPEGTKVTPAPNPPSSPCGHLSMPPSPSFPSAARQGPTSLHPQGRSFHNGRFVQRLRARALAEPNVTVVNGIVSRLLYAEPDSPTSRVIGVEYKIGTGRRVRNADGEEVEEKEVRRAMAPLTLVADGLWSSLRTHVDKAAKPTQLSSFVGLILSHPPMASPLPHPHCGHVVLADPSPVLLYQISSTETRVLVDIFGRMPSASTGDLAHYLSTHIQPQLPPVLQAPFAAAVARGEFKSMPNRSMPAANVDRDGVLMVGDALNMRHPLTGGGMTVALRDVEALCYLLETSTDLGNPAAMRVLKGRFARERKAWAATINVLANALHAVFSTPAGNPTRKDLRDACFDYLSVGGYCAGGPINLLSGLTPRPSILALHFFLVAFHGVRKYLWPVPSWGGLGRTYEMLQVACEIIMPLLSVEKSTVLAAWPVRALVGLIFPYGR